MTGGVRCKRCGYDLRELRDERCPECGRSFDPTRPGTYLTRPENGRTHLRWAVAGLALFLVPLILSGTTDLFSGPPTAVRMFLMMLVGPGLMVASFGIEVMTLATSILVLLNRQPWVIQRPAFYASFLVSLAVVIGFIGLTIVQLM